MIYSMTAFARSHTEHGGFALSWELRSVNHRYLETQFRMPDVFRPQEFPLRETLRKHLSRGKIDCTLHVDRVGSNATMELNRPLLRQLLDVMEQLQRGAPNLSPASTMDLLRWPGILGDDLSMEDPGVITRLTALFKEALEQLVAHRGREGERLCQAVSQRLNEIDATVSLLNDFMAGAAQRAQAKLRQRIAELEAKMDHERLEQEVALLAQRADVAEELDRLTIHVAEARTNLESAGPHGRRLDFLTQELNREANTLGAKSAMAESSQMAVDLKVIIEQIREQVQNIE